MTRRFHSFRAAAIFSILIVTFVLTGCASLTRPHTITFSEADMARLMNQHGPFERRLLEVLDVRINRPTVRLLPQTARLASDFEAVTTERVSGKTYQGRLSIDYGLRYDDFLQAIRLSQVHVNDLRIAGLPSPQQAGLHRLGALIAEEMLEGAVIYRFKPSDLKTAEGRGLRPGDVAVTSKGVQITLSPISR